MDCISAEKRSLECEVETTSGCLESSKKQLAEVAQQLERSQNNMNNAKAEHQAELEEFTRHVVV